MCTQRLPTTIPNSCTSVTVAFNQYINAKVLPTLVEKKGEYMLKSLVARGESQNYGEMVIEILNYLDRYQGSEKHITSPSRMSVMNCFEGWCTRRSS